MIHKDLLHEHPRNSNKQNRHTFSELRESIRENGFDESLLVTPRDDGDGYWIISGNHRCRAGIAEGMEEFPCVIRADWNDVDEQIQLVRRNYVRGSLDKDAFTVAVNMIAEENALTVDDVREAMGFQDSEVFLQFYRQEHEINKEVERKRSDSAPKVK
ncbi:MAG: ParB/RepB/Spo0J family partition protein, partial [Candidatus Thorarchaeota archaeon]